MQIYGSFSYPTKYFGEKFGHLAQFRLVIWRKYVWLFGAISFGHLA